MLTTVLGAAAWALDPGYMANGNALTSSLGGGRGEYSTSLNNLNALTIGPGGINWGGDRRREAGGLGAYLIPGYGTTRVFFGGGGGAGDTGNLAGGGGGGRGGGIVYAVAWSITGTGTISASGENGHDTVAPHNDGAGGGGGGGTVVLRSDTVAGVSLSANGGNGGRQLIATNESEGPGGGGGGGLVAAPAGSALASAAGGGSGTTSSAALTEFPVNGATTGASGSLIVLPPGSGGVDYVVVPGLSAIGSAVLIALLVGSALALGARGRRPVEA